MSSKFWHRVVGCACAVLVAGGIAACGSSSKSSTSSASAPASGTSSATSSASSGTGTTSGGSSSAAATVKADMKLPTGINITTPLKSKPATGKTIVFLRCSQPVCAGFEQGLTPAAKALGWTLKSVPFQPTPEASNQALLLAVQQHPDGIFMTGLDAATIQGGLAAAQKAHIPVVDGYDLNPAKPPIIANVANGPSGNTFSPTAIANDIAADNNCSGDTALFTIPTYPILTYGTATIKAELTKLCPDMKITVVDAQATDVGTKLPAQVTSELQSNPNIKYAAFAFGDMTLGVSAALKAAGISAKLFGYGAAEPTNVQNIAAGTEDGEGAYGIPYGGYRAMDAFARNFEGMSTAIDTSAKNPGTLYTPDNAKTVTGWSNMAVAPNMPQLFYKLWHVSGS
jgi:ribose transport system substrate-binding protein